MTGYDIPCKWCDRTGDIDRTILLKTEEGMKYSDIKAICSECVLKLFSQFYSRENIYALSAKFLGVTPIFKKKDFEVIKNHCFYLGPFKDPFTTIYNDHIVQTLEKIGFTVKRADDIYSVQVLMEDIWEGICSASIIVAEVTGRNPNVMYEIGISHTVGKPVVILTHEMDDVPFDLKAYRCIEYEYTPRGCREMEAKLKNTILSIDKGRSYKSE